MKKYLMALFFISISVNSFAFSEQVRQSVWVNEAIVAAYQFNAQNVEEKQRQLSRYFSSSGWQAYSQALVASNLLDTVKKNNFSVSSVAMQPPKIKKVAANHWQAEMPLLVLYENPKYSEQQKLMVTITFQPADKSHNEERYMIGSMQTRKIDDPCPCSKVFPRTTPKIKENKASSSDEQPAEGK